MIFEGASWLINDVKKFGGPALDLINDENACVLIYGLAVEGFGGPTWFDAAGKPSANHYLESVPGVTRERIAGGSGTLVFDMSNEGPAFQPHLIAAFHDSLFQFGIPARRCVLLQQNRCFESHYHEWAQSRGVEPVKALIYDHFPRRMAGLLSMQKSHLDIVDSVRERRFLCLNFTPRSWRIGLVSWLLGNDFDRLGYISFSKFDTSKQDVGVPSVPEWFPEMEATLRGFEMLKKRLPLVLDLDSDNSNIPEYNVGSDGLYSGSYFSIVTESEVSSGEIVRVTEKTLKPLAMMHPLIIFGNPHSLRLLRSLGFKTFGELFDESYDEMEDPKARTAAVMEEVERVLALPPEEIHRIYHSMRPTLLHNASLVRYSLNEFYTHVRQPELISAMACLPRS